MGDRRDPKEESCGAGGPASRRCGLSWRRARVIVEELRATRSLGCQSLIPRASNSGNPASTPPPPRGQYFRATGGFRDPRREKASVF